MRQWINTLAGLWLMTAPSVLNYGSNASDNGHIVGPVIVTFSVIAMWDCTRNTIRWNIPLAIWLLIVPFLLDYTNFSACLSDISAGVFIFILSIKEIKAGKNYNGGWSYLWKPLPIENSLNKDYGSGDTGQN